ncbi:pentatricopeptide repeat-containing protein At5g66520-like [Salvia miltiorrhiza]|uniref:pentatricopeptide repeat-containing protein At5g66520-like n=1 Tax=Salvia miltiorrhiza TaxID=226208 RepID=UPI0025AD5368|nr:pentatricopeptide repeat-containing protein At5g66520-like [Salvia miltiorrhiza]XP_057806283.1 pentatricopeptide repeat-containing protein At5g66520-like [Salvia miltiorrhiza]XP_057806284.1 pentatricopeptide repeat-containing protein At5g66520-like [Salvia miltiorrhiza]
MQPLAFSQISVRFISQLLSRRPRISQIKQIHAQIIVRSLASARLSLIDSLIHCYLHSKSFNSARILFDNYRSSPPPPILLWNLMMRAYSKLQHSSEPINLFRQMINTQAKPDDYTFTFVITSCAHQDSVVCGRIIHGMALKNGTFLNLYVANSLIGMYAAFERVQDARDVFGEMSETDVFSWTSLVSAYAKNRDMRKAGEVFCKMPVRNDVSWAVMISGFVRSGRYTEALRYFHDMFREFEPNEAVLVCALSACANLGSLDQGKWIHGYVDSTPSSQSSNAMTALIDMYAKCGRIDCAYRVFDKIMRPDIHNYTSLISGLSIHGLGEEAIRVFQRMLAEKLSPNEITVLGVLNGCSHSGLVQQGSSIFYSMESSWGVVPKIEHYGCYVDLLGRAGYLAKAFGIAKSMPFNPDVVVWRALLSACRIHSNLSFGERIISYLEQLDSGSFSGTNVLLSNLYASLGKWEKVTQVRKVMGKQMNPAGIGCSWIEVGGVVHEFRVADVLHPQIVEIREKLGEILKRVGVVGYAADATHVSFDLNEEDREQAVAWHSEKLAVAFGLMSSVSGASIRIMKNLRTCEDCHAVLKAISKVYDREIVVRDRARFHTFKQGKCSCKDYW